MEYGILLRLVSVMNLILFYLIHSLFKGDNPTYVISLKTTTTTKPLNVGLYSDIYGLCMMTGTTNLDLHLI